MTSTREADAFGNLTSFSGGWQGPFGYQEDATGLKLLGHRYYDPSTGRFLTRDPIKDGRNWCVYGAGEANPLTGADPDGLHYVIIVRNGGHIHVGLVNHNGAVIWSGGRPPPGGKPWRKPRPSHMVHYGGVALHDVPAAGTGFIHDISEQQYKLGADHLSEMVKAGIAGQNDYCLTTNNCIHFADGLLEAMLVDVGHENIGTAQPWASQFMESIQNSGLGWGQWSPGSRIPNDRRDGIGMR